MYAVHLSCWPHDFCPIWTLGAGFMYCTTKHCYKFNIYAVGLIVSEVFFFSFSHYKSIGDIDLQGLASLNPKGLIDRTYAGYL